MAIENVSYFAYEVNAWDSERERINLGSKDANELVKSIEGGENLFGTIPNLSPEMFNGFKLDYALFEQREEEIKVDGRRFFSEEGFKQVGRLMIPFYNLHSRSSLVERSRSDRIFERSEFTELLKKHPGVERFYTRGLSYYPVNHDALILHESQLISPQ